MIVHLKLTAEHNMSPLTLGTCFYLGQAEKLLNAQKEVRLFCGIYISRITLKHQNENITSMRRNILTYTELVSDVNFGMPLQQYS